MAAKPEFQTPKFELHDAKDYVSKQAGRISPADKMVASLGGEYFTIRNVADIIGIGKETVRRTIKSTKTSVTHSKVLTHGKMEILLFSRDDLLKIADHFDKRQIAVDYLKNK